MLRVPVLMGREFWRCGTVDTLEQRDALLSAAMNPAFDRNRRKSSASSHISGSTTGKYSVSSWVVDGNEDGRRLCSGGLGAGRGFSNTGRIFGLDIRFVTSRSIGMNLVVGASPCGNGSVGDILREDSIVPSLNGLVENIENSGDDVLSDKLSGSKNVYDFIGFLTADHPLSNKYCLGEPDKWSCPMSYSSG